MSTEPVMLSNHLRFLSLYEWKSNIPLEVRALKMSYHVYFRLYVTFLTCIKKQRIQRLK